jgi:hypothetical protein
MHRLSSLHHRASAFSVPLIAAAAFLGLSCRATFAADKLDAVADRIAARLGDKLEAAVLKKLAARLGVKASELGLEKTGTRASAPAADLAFAPAVAKLKTRNAELGVANDTAAEAKVATVAESLLETPFAGHSLHVNGGFVAAAPYKTKFTPAVKADPAKKIAGSPSKLELEGNDAGAKAYVEFVYDNHWAWSDLRRRPGGAAPATTEYIWTNPGNEENRSVVDFIDYQARIGYTFNQDDKSAATVVGTGEFDAEVSIEPRLVERYCGDGSKWSINSVFSYGAITDKGTFDIHNRWFVGLGWYSCPHLSVKGDVANSHAFFMVRMGAANIETPVFSGKGTELETVHGGTIPAYRAHWGLALESELYVPVNDSTSIIAGGRLYADGDPSLWSIFLGASIDPSAIGKSLTKLVGGE